MSTRDVHWALDTLGGPVSEALLDMSVATVQTACGAAVDSGHGIGHRDRSGDVR